MTNTPKCPTCKGKSVAVKFTSFEYFYCQECKKEVEDVDTYPTSGYYVSDDWGDVSLSFYPAANDGPKCYLCGVRINMKGKYSVCDFCT